MVGPAYTNLDMDVLRTFVCGIDFGSYVRAAERLGRSPSAISLQLRKLEEQTGQVLLIKKGRGLIPTEAGETLLRYARRLLDLNDETVMALRGSAVSGWVRLGLPQDLADTWLPGLLARFSRAYPNVRVEAQVDRNMILLENLATGQLDLALIWEESGKQNEHTLLVDLPMVWVGPEEGFIRDPDQALPLVSYPAPCIFRQTAAKALDAAGISWRVAFSSPGLSGLWAAVSAGLGVTLRTPVGLPASLSILDAEQAGLPPLPAIGVSLQSATDRVSPAVTRLEAILRETLAGNYPAKRNS